MRFISYPHLILLISSQTLEITMEPKKFWDVNKTLYQFRPQRCTDIITQNISKRLLVLYDRQAGVCGSFLLHLRVFVSLIILQRLNKSGEFPSHLNKGGGFSLKKELSYPSPSHMASAKSTSHNYFLSSLYQRRVTSISPCAPLVKTKENRLVHLQNQNITPRARGGLACRGSRGTTGGSTSTRLFG